MPNFIQNLFTTIKLRASSASKDPNDYTKTALSTNWEIDDHYCSKCLKSTNTTEFMSDVCSHCGSFMTQVRYGRSYRKLRINGKWKYQIQYRKHDKIEIRDEWY